MKELIGKAEKQAWKYIESKYRLDDEVANLVAIDYCRDCQIIADADVAIRKDGLVITSEKGAKYQNPAVGIRNKSTAHRNECLVALEKYRKKNDGKGGDDLQVIVKSKAK